MCEGLGRTIMLHDKNIPPPHRLPVLVTTPPPSLSADQFKTGFGHVGVQPLLPAPTRSPSWNPSSGMILG